MSERVKIFCICIVLAFWGGCNGKSSVGNACQGIDCGPNGECIINEEGSAECSCEDGYHAEGLTCVETVDPVCGNDSAEGDEVCDGNDLRGVTCEALGFDGGDLGCRDDCTQFDLSGCMTGDCGNGVADPGEVCDGDDLRGQSCESLGFESGVLGCLGDCSYYDTSGCDTFCGDGMAGGDEECDGDDFRGQTCESLGYHGGTLACVQSTCTYDLSSCMSAGRCGDNILQSDYEVCDGDDLGGETCVSQGLYEGTLACDADCNGFDVSGCGGFCGDGEINGSEFCDGDDVGAETCVSQGLYEGTLVCEDDCNGFDVSGCGGFCGDGEINGSELCDGDNLGGHDCSTIGRQFRGGVLRCNSTCDDWDDSECTYHCDKTIITPITPLPEESRALGAGQVVNGKIYLFGGTDDTSHSTTSYRDTVWVYDIAGDTYDDLGSVLPYGISIYASYIALGDNGKFYMPPCLGTSHNNGWGTHSSVIEFDPAGPTGVEKASFGANRWGSVSANGGNGSIYFFGSYDGSQILDIHRYNPAADELTMLSATLPRRGQGAAFLASDDKIYMPTVGNPPKMMVFDPTDETLTELDDPLPCNARWPTWELPQGTLWGTCTDNSTDPAGWGYYTFDMNTHETSFVWLHSWEFPHPIYGEIEPSIQVMDPETGYIFLFGGQDVVPPLEPLHYNPSAMSWRIECIGPALCGNGLLEDGEECDDGNVESGDGCSSTCELE